MPRVIQPSDADPVIQTLMGAIDTGDGGTSEQRRVVAAFAAGYWGRADLDVDTITPLSPDEAAAAITDPAARRRVRELLVLTELCRHPFTEAQATRTESYAAALGESGPGLELARTLVRDGAAMAMADYQRRSGTVYGDLSEVSLRATHAHQLDAPDLELGRRLRALGELPVGTLGRTYHDFLDTNGFDFPGESVNVPAVFVAHDMCHVITGYGPSGQEEISVNAMQVAVNDSDAHWIQLLGSLSIHEAGFLETDYAPLTATMDRDGAPEMVADAFRRGAECSGDYTRADHLALVGEPLESVRATFGIPPRVL